MTTLHKKKLNIDNTLANTILKKELNYLNAELHRQLIQYDKSKRDARRFMRKMRRCHTDRHPDSMRYLASERLQHSKRKLTVFPPIQSSFVQQKAIHAETRRRCCEKHNRAKVLPPISVKPSVDTIQEIEHSEYTTDKCALTNTLTNPQTVDDIIEAVSNVNSSRHKLSKIDSAMPMINIGEQSKSAKRLSRMRV